MRAPARATFSAAALYLALLGLVLASAALFLLRERQTGRFWGFALDDSWIHATIARNLAEGRGFTFNPGEHAAGSTAPLYTVLLAGLYTLFHNSIWPAKILGVLCQWASSALVYHAMLRIDPAGRAKAVLAALLVALSPVLLWASLSGMEIPAYLLLVCLGIHWHASGAHVRATATWALGIWLRPDGIFLVALDLAVTRRDRWKRLAAAAAIVILYVGFNLVSGGTLFPQTVGAKAHFGFEAVRRTWNLFREWGALWGLPYGPAHELEHPVALLAALAVGAALLLRKRPLYALYAVGLPLALSLFREHSGSGKRYILYVIPFGMMLAATGLERLAVRLSPARPHRLLVALGAAVLLWQLAYVYKKSDLYGWNVQNINFMQRRMGIWAGAVTGPEDRIATNDIGAIAYFSRRPIVDLVGLVTPQTPLPDALSTYRPALLIIFVDWFKDYAEYDPKLDTFTFYDADSSHKYMVVAGVELSRNTISAKDQMLMFRRLDRDSPPPSRRYLRRY